MDTSECMVKMFVNGKIYIYIYMVCTSFGRLTLHYGKLYVRKVW